jgi:hypothetical protein
MRNSFCSRGLLRLIAAVAFLLPAHAQGPAGETSTGGQAASLPDAPKPAHSVPQYHPPSSADRWHEYFFDAFGPIAIGRAAIGGAILQLRNTPPDWRQGAGPFAQRVASQYGLAMLNYTAEYGVGAVLRQDMKYYRCVCNGVLPRVGHAARMTLGGPQGRRRSSRLLGPEADRTLCCYHGRAHLVSRSLRSQGRLARRQLQSAGKLRNKHRPRVHPFLGAEV